MYCSKRDPPNQDSPRLDTRVARALRESCHPSLLHVRCEVSEGLAVLQGRTPSHYLKQLAQEIARRTEGVERVVNRIVVTTDAT